MKLQVKILTEGCGKSNSIKEFWIIICYKKEPNLFHDYGLHVHSMKAAKEKYISHIM